MFGDFVLCMSERTIIIYNAKRSYSAEKCQDPNFGCFDEYYIVLVCAIRCFSAAFSTFRTDLVDENAVV